MNDILIERYNDRSDELDQWSTDPTIYVSFTQLPKIGINPQSSYDTPLGIYAYPLKEMWRDIERHRIPYAGDEPFIQVLQSDQVTEFAFYTTDDLIHDITKLKQKFSTVIRLSDEVKATLQRTMIFRLFDQLPASLSDDDLITKKQDIRRRVETDVAKMDEDGRAFGEMVRKWSREALPTQHPACKMWNITRCIAKQINQKRSPVTWNAILRDLGYVAFSDKTGMGLIHPNEPIAAVFLTKSAFRHLRTIDNIRKHEEPYGFTRLDDLTYILSSDDTSSNTLKLRHQLLKDWPTLVLFGSNQHFEILASSFEETTEQDFPEFMHALLRIDFHQFVTIAEVLRRTSFFHNQNIIESFLAISPTARQLPLYLEVMLGDRWMAYSAAYYLQSNDGRLEAIQHKVGEIILTKISNVGKHPDSLTPLQEVHLRILLDGQSR